MVNVAVDQGSGPVVVLVHGIASSSVTFTELLPLLQGYRVIAVDLLGFGTSSSPADARFTIEEHVEAIERTLGALKLKRRVTLVGHSMGALIVARLARRNPHLFSGVILVSPPIYPAPGALGDPHEHDLMRLYLSAFDFLRTNRTFTKRGAAVLSRFFPQPGMLTISDQNWHAFTASLERTIEEQTAVDDVSTIAAPVRVVYGSLDPLIFPPGIRLLGALRNVEVVQVPGGDHLIRRTIAEAIGGQVHQLSAVPRPAS